MLKHKLKDYFFLLILYQVLSSLLVLFCGKVYCRALFWGNLTATAEFENQRLSSLRNILKLAFKTSIDKREIHILCQVKIVVFFHAKFEEDKYV